jgi:hypothetical protein
MSMALVAETPFVVPFAVRGLTAGAIAADRELAASLRDCLEAMVVAVAHYRQDSASRPVAERSS